MSSKVSRWLKTYTALGTQKRYRAALDKFCGHYNITPEETLEWDLETIEDAMIDWKSDLQEQGRAGATIITSFAAVKQWFFFNRKRIVVQCKNVSPTRTYLDYIPSRDDVQRLLDSSKIHHKVVIALMAFSGLRPVDVSSLEYRHIKASYEAGEEVLTIIKKHQKTKQWYPTFLGHQGTRYLRGYLQERQLQGEVIEDDTPIVVWNGKGIKPLGIVIGLQRIIRRSVGRHPTGESFRVFRSYALRKYFRRALDKLGEATAEFLMGHRSGLESLVATYSGLRDLDPQAINRLKKEYIKLLPELETEITDGSLRVQIEDMEETQKTRQVELSDLKADVLEMKEYLRQLREQEEG